MVESLVTGSLQQLHHYSIHWMVESLVTSARCMTRDTLLLSTVRLYSCGLQVAQGLHLAALLANSDW